MKVFIDFDDVIFNTKKFKEDLKLIFAKFNVSAEEYEQTYYDLNDERRIKVYDPRAQVTRLLKYCNVDCQQLLQAIGDFMNSGQQYVFSDVISLINFIGKENAYLLSYGDINFQEEKIKNCGIKKYIKNIIITSEIKSCAIKKVIKNEKFIFLDDRIEQIRDVKEKFPNAITFLIKRPEGRYQEMQMEKCCDWEVCNLTEAQEIIKTIIK